LHVGHAAQAAPVDLLPGILARVAGVLLPSSHSLVHHCGPARPLRRIEGAAEEGEIDISESLTTIDRVDASQPTVAVERCAIESALRQGQEPGASTGLGLGLYIARMLVEAHGGRICAKSEPGQGSTFVISLPR
jgi:hypothetical protein